MLSRDQCLRCSGQNGRCLVEAPHESLWHCIYSESGRSLESPQAMEIANFSIRAEGRGYVPSSRPPALISGGLRAVSGRRPCRTKRSFFVAFGIASIIYPSPVEHPIMTRLMRKTEIKSLVPLLRRRSQVVLSLLLGHGAPYPFASSIDRDVEDLCSYEDQDVCERR